MKSAQAATEMQDLVSFYVGCKTGRFTVGGGEYYENGVHPVSEEELIQGFSEFLSEHFGSRSVDADLAFVEEGLGMPLSRYFKKQFYKHHRMRYREHPILFRIREGNTVLYIPVHRTKKAAKALSRYPLSNAFRSRLARTLCALSAGDGYRKNAEKLAEFM